MDIEKVSNGLCEAIGIIHAFIPKQHLGYAEQACRDAISLLKEQDDCIRILNSDLEDWQKEHEKLLNKKIPLITNGQEVIRCKDCKHYKDGFCYNPNTYDDGKTKGNTVPDWYCADGERREPE